ncbi:TraB/GumN family protein [bacterium]
MKLGKQSCKIFICLIIITTVIFNVSIIHAQDHHNSLWELSSRKSQLYFLGSIHLLSEDDYPLDASIEDAYQKSDKLYFEIAMDSIAMFNVQQKMMMAGMLQNQTLSDVLSDSTYQSLSKELLKYNIQIAALNGLKPWLVSTMLTMAKLNALGIDPQYGIDQYVFKKAKEDGKKTGGMEFIDDQIKCFNALDGGLEEAMLIETIQSLDELESEFFHLKKAWKTGQASVIDSVMNHHMNAYPDLKKILLDNRNERWMMKVEEMIRNREKALIVVGVGHLVGDGSLIDLLRKRGYKVRQR